MRAGYRAATGDILVVVDADGSNDPREIPRFVQALVEGADFAKGSRFAPHGGTTDMPRIRKMGHAAFVRMVNLLFDAIFTDLCYGYHAFWRYCLDAIDLADVDGFEIDTALYLRALRERLRITEVPSFEGFRFYGVGKLQTVPDGWRVLRTILKEWWAMLRSPAKNGHLGFRGSIPPGAEAVRPLPAPTDLQLLGAVCGAFSAELNMRGLLKHVLQLTLDSAQAASGSIVLMDEAGGILDGYVAFAGEIRALNRGEAQDTVRQGLAGWVIENRRPALVSRTDQDPRWLRQLWEVKEGRSRSALGVPLMAEDRVVGVLTLTRPGPGQFSEADVDHLAAKAGAMPAWAPARLNGRNGYAALPPAARRNGRYEAIGWTGVN
jgi:hypothetical protein